MIAWFIFFPFLIWFTCMILSLYIGLEDLNSNIKLIVQFKGSLVRMLVCLDNHMLTCFALMIKCSHAHMYTCSDVCMFIYPKARMLMCSHVWMLAKNKVIVCIDGRYPNILSSSFYHHSPLVLWTVYCNLAFYFL